MHGMIPKLAHELIDDITDRGEADLFTAFCDPMSVRSLRSMLGLDEVPWQDILAWNQGMMPGLANFEGDPDKQAPADRASVRGRQGEPQGWTSRDMSASRGVGQKRPRDWPR
jgi:cytochrome P450